MEIGEPRRDFDTLNAALLAVKTEKITGYITTPDGDVIDVRKGKRRAADKKGWVEINAFAAN
jgi:hypothetical protein